MIRNQRKCKKMFCLNENSHDIKYKLENPLIYLKEYFKFLNMLYNITWFGVVYA